jgi:hypothetical protein
MWRTQVNVGTADQTTGPVASPVQQIPSTPKPPTLGARLRAFLAWRKLDRAAAIDSAKNVFAILGVGAVLADFATMKPLLLVPGAFLLVGVWYADYLRHF